MGLVGPDDVPEAEDTRAEVEHEAVRRDERLARQLAGPVGRDGDERPVVLARLDLAQVPVHATARGVQHPGHARAPRRLDHVMREQRALIEVDRRIGRGAGDVGVRRQVDHGVRPGHGLHQVVEIAHVGFHHAQPSVVGMGLEMPTAARREVVEHGDAVDPVGQ